MRKSSSSDIQTDSVPALRQKAEEKPRTQIERLRTLSFHDIRYLAQKLGMRKIELERQNEKLRRAQEELAAVRSGHAERHDFAPTGYFTLDARMLIQEVNLPGAQMLGIERELLLNQSFVGFIAEAEDREIFFRHRNEILQKKGKHACEIRIRRKDGKLFSVQLQSRAKENTYGKAGSIRIAIFDITNRRQAEEALERSYSALELYVKERSGKLIKANEQPMVITGQGASLQVLDRFKTSRETREQKNA